MFNHPRNSNFNPNDNASKTKALFRFVFWSALIHPVGLVAAFMTYHTLTGFGFDARTAFVFAAAVLLIESALLRTGLVYHQWALWANAFRFRRRWHRVWTSTGKVGEDHTTFVVGLVPVLGVVPSFQGDLVTWSVRPPSGKTLEYVAELTNVIAAHNEPVNLVEVLFDSPRSSKGDLQVLFGKSIPTQNPEWADTPKDKSNV